MIRITITNLPETEMNMITDLEFVGDNKFSEEEKDSIIRKYKTIDSEFIDRFQLQDGKSYFAKILEVDRSLIDVHIHIANTCIEDCN